MAFQVEEMSIQLIEALVPLMPRIKQRDFPRSEKAASVQFNPVLLTAHLNWSASALRAARARAGGAGGSIGVASGTHRSETCGMPWWRQAAPGIMVALDLVVLGCGSTGSTSSTDSTSSAGSTGPSAGGEGGADDGSAAGGVGGAAEAVPPLDGRWAMFAFEDPVAVALSEDAGVLSGLGCYGGLPSPEFPDISGSCRKLTGTADGRHVQFSFAADGYTYAANVYASADGQRMAGDFHDTATWHAAAFTWLRIGADYPWLQPSREPTAVGLALETRNGAYGLEGLVDHYDRPGYLAIYGAFRAIAGSLGAFWESEITWNEAEQTLVAGPVAETAPEIATQLTLHFEGEAFVSVDAVFPSGETRTLQAAPYVSQ